MRSGSDFMTPRSSIHSLADVASIISEDTLRTSQVWEENASSCAVCNAVIGKMSRHHCRVCGKCVCSVCSPSTIQLDVQKRPQRACTPCVAGVQQAHAVRKRVGLLGGRLCKLGGMQVTDPVENGGLREATALCEAALLQLEEEYARAKDRAFRAEAEAASERLARQPLEEALFAAKQRFDRVAADASTERTRRLQLEAEAATMKYALRTLGDRLHGLLCHEGVRPPTEDGRVEEIFAFCEAAVGPLAEALKRDRRSWPWSSSLPPQTRKEDEAPAVLDNNSQADSLKSSLSVNTEDWDEDTRSCAVCGTIIGKRRFKPRHHCRLCGKCVCSACSPNTMQLEAEKKPQRICTPCISGTKQAAALARRLALVNGRLAALAGDPAPEARVAAGGGILEQAVICCESSLASLEAMYSGGSGGCGGGDPAATVRDAAAATPGPVAAEPMPAVGVEHAGEAPSF